MKTLLIVLTLGMVFGVIARAVTVSYSANPQGSPSPTPCKRSWVDQRILVQRVALETDRPFSLGRSNGMLAAARASLPHTGVNGKQ
jgi:hypothetical protein